MSPAATAAPLEAAAWAPVSAAAAAAFSGFAELSVTEWPARTNEPASALPTFPEPMIAMFTGITPSELVSNRWNSSIRDNLS